MVAEPCPDTGLVLASELLQDHLAFQVTAELVDPEELAVVEGREVVDIDLPGLEKGHQTFSTGGCQPSPQEGLCWFKAPYLSSTSFTGTQRGSWNLLPCAHL